VEVLREVGADIAALQEVHDADHGRREESQARYIAEELGFHYSFGENRRVDGGGYGNLILSRFPLTLEKNYDLSRRGYERRGCLRVDVVIPHGCVLHVYNAHLGTSYWERRHQGRQLVHSGILEDTDLEGPRILLGDFNEWFRGLASRLLSGHFRCTDIRSHLGRRRTYPGPVPLFHLDHVYFDNALEIERAHLHRSFKALVASDHLPIVADFRFCPPCKRQKGGGFGEASLPAFAS
jgi:endonuclease/exonuclease/phosphatase family metal-dependent hydrolase